MKGEIKVFFLLILFSICSITSLENSVFQEQKESSVNYKEFISLPFFPDEELFLEKIVDFIDGITMDRIIQNRDLIDEFEDRIENMNTLRGLGFILSQKKFRQILQKTSELLNDNIGMFTLLALISMLQKDSNTESYHYCFLGLGEFLELDKSVLESFLLRKQYKEIIVYMIKETKL